MILGSLKWTVSDTIHKAQTLTVFYQFVIRNQVNLIMTIIQSRLTTTIVVKTSDEWPYIIVQNHNASL